jgi:hypothetical protein
MKTNSQKGKKQPIPRINEEWVEEVKIYLLIGVAAPKNFANL